MGEVFRAAEDPHWDLILAIAEGLFLDGAYSVRVERPAGQHLIDLRWSAREVGRIFAISTEVEVTASRDDETVAVSITRTDATSRSPVERRERWEALLRAVDRNHLKAVRPDPRPDER